METTYRTAQDRSMFIKFTTHEAMIDSLSKNAEPQSFVYTSGKSVEVRMAVAGSNMRYIRVFDLPPEVPDDMLSSVLGEFGKVDRLVREKFSADVGLGHMYTGVRGVHMDVQKNIPPSIDVMGRKANIFYDGLKDTCFLCHSTGHRRDLCPERKPRNKQEKKTQGNPVSSSYAAVVSGKHTSSEDHNSTEGLEQEIIEVLDEEFLEGSTETEEIEQSQPNTCVAVTVSEKEMRHKENMQKLEEAAIVIKEAIENKTAKDRRAQFAASASNSSSLPRKKVARRTFY